MATEDLDWLDSIVADAAVHLIRAGHARAAEAVLTSSEVTLQYGDSWWDGHDDYIHDVKLTIVSDPDVIPVLAAIGKELPSAFGEAVHVFGDDSGTMRRGDLVRFHPLIGETVIDEARLLRRRAAVARHLPS